MQLFCYERAGGGGGRREDRRYPAEKQRKGYRPGRYPKQNAQQRLKGGECLVLERTASFFVEAFGGLGPVGSEIVWLQTHEREKRRVSVRRRKHECDGWVVVLSTHVCAYGRQSDGHSTDGRRHPNARERPRQLRQGREACRFDVQRRTRRSVQCSLLTRSRRLEGRQGQKRAGVLFNSRFSIDR